MNSDTMVSRNLFKSIINAIDIERDNGKEIEKYEDIDVTNNTYYVKKVMFETLNTDDVLMEFNSKDFVGQNIKFRNTIINISLTFIIEFIHALNGIDFKDVIAIRSSNFCYVDRQVVKCTFDGIEFKVGIVYNDDETFSLFITKNNIDTFNKFIREHDYFVLDNFGNPIFDRDIVSITTSFTKCNHTFSERYVSLGCVLMEEKTKIIVPRHPMESGNFENPYKIILSRNNQPYNMSYITTGEDDNIFKYVINHLETWDDVVLYGNYRLKSHSIGSDIEMERVLNNVKEYTMSKFKNIPASEPCKYHIVLKYYFKNDGSTEYHFNTFNEMIETVLQLHDRSKYLMKFEKENEGLTFSELITNLVKDSKKKSNTKGFKMSIKFIDTDFISNDTGVCITIDDNNLK